MAQKTRSDILASTDFNPYEHRERPGQTNRFETLVNLVKGILGTGILAMPEAFLNSGLIIGTVFNVIITFLVTYCLHLLFDGMYFICKRDKISQITYPQAFKEGLKVGPKIFQRFADKAPYIVNAFIIVYQTGVLCVYLVFCATNVKQIVDINTDEKTHMGVELYMVFFLIPLLLLCYIKNLKYLAPFSNVANWLTLIGLVIIYYFVFKKIEPISERNLFAHISKFPLFMGTCMFSLLSIGSILSIELNAKDGHYWGKLFGTLDQAMIVVTILNILTGFGGYWKYGEQSESSITLNIDITDKLAQSVRGLFAAAILISYPLQAYPTTEILWEQYLVDYFTTSEHKLVWDYVLRTIFVLFSFLLAVAIPRLGLFISLFGALCLSVLGLIFPPFLDICLRWPDDFGAGKLKLYKNIGLMIFGFLGFTFGTYSAIFAIVVSFTQPK